MSKKIAYEAHPVSPERKKELREQGYVIVDARFKPANAQPQLADKPQKKE